LEQLNWRRWTILNKCEARLDVFHQEYPSTPEQAFLTTGRQVFSRIGLSQVSRDVEMTDPIVPSPDNPGPELLLLEQTGSRMVKGGGAGVMEMPTGVELRPRDREPCWHGWQQPEPGVDGARGSQRIIGCDVMSGEETPDGEQAWHAVSVIAHATGA